MKRCLGPCVGLADPEAYRDQVRGTILFLRGRSRELVENIESEMARAAEEERFEDAARLRDRIQAVERTIESQQIVSEQTVDRDVFALAREGGEVDVQVLHVREGRVIGARGFPFSNVKIDDGEVMSSFLGQFYGSGDGHSPPREVLTSVDFEDEGALPVLWRERFGQAVDVRRPQRGGGRRLVEIAERNASLALVTRLAARESVDTALDELEERCRLSKRPRRIECYDVSNLQGTLAVASRVYFEDGEPVKKDYRRYRIREAEAGDDYGCMREVLDRRLRRVESEPLPDLLMVDGGRGQVAVVMAALEDAGLEVEVLGISKERDAESPSVRVKRSGGLKAERVYRPGRLNPILLPPSSRGMLLLQRVRDESHRFAIEFQRELRSKVNMTSILEELPGIGPTKRRALLRERGSLRAVRTASLEELEAVTGISRRDAQTIRDFFDALTAPEPAGELPEECERGRADLRPRLDREARGPRGLSPSGLDMTVHSQTPAGAAPSSEPEIIAADAELVAVRIADSHLAVAPGLVDGGALRDDPLPQHLGLPGIDVGHVQVDEHSQRAVALVLGEIEPQAAPRDLEEDRQARLVAPLPVDREAEAVDVEALRRLVRADAQCGDGGVHPRRSLMARASVAPPRRTTRQHRDL